MDTTPHEHDSPHSQEQRAPQRRAATAWLVLLWSIGLFVIFAVTGAVCIAALLLVLTPMFPELRWKLPPIRCLPIVFVAVWGSGVLLAGCIHRSWKVAGYLTGVGVFILVFGPILFFLSWLALFGRYGGP